MLPCDICGKTNHVWFNCPKKPSEPGWKPERLRKPAVDTITLGNGSRINLVGKKSDVIVSTRPDIEKMTEAALNAGKTVATIGPGGVIEVRGPGAAKDITPPPRDRIIVGVDYGSDEGTVEVIGKVADGKLEILSITTKPGRGRPKSIDDMKAYKAAKQRLYRQRQKEGK